MEIILDSIITCPLCGFQTKEKMSEDACQYFYECKSCHQILKPLKGDCCVYCSYGTILCPSIQRKRNGDKNNNICDC